MEGAELFFRGTSFIGRSDAVLFFDVDEISVIMGNEAP